jgi:two-component system sensor kinase FixL
MTSRGDTDDDRMTTDCNPSKSIGRRGPTLALRPEGRRAEAEQLLDAQQSARDHEAQLRAVLDTAVDAIITIDERGLIESFNRAARRMFGYEPREVIGRNVRMLMPEPYHAQHDTYLANYRRTAKARIIGIGREVVARRKDGGLFPIDLAVSAVRLRGRRTFTGIVRDITDRKRMEKEILEISEREQRRIGQDLHDGLCQQLTGIAFLVQALQKKLAANAQNESALAAQVSGLLKEAVNQARDLSHGLYPVDPQPNGLAVGLAQLASNIQNQFNIQCRFRSPAPVAVPDNSVATHLYRIAQEAAQNAIRHGKASRIIIDLADGRDGLRLSVSDNGVGFPQAKALNPGIGLRTMSHRAQVVGGTLRIRRQAKGGTRVDCELKNKP